MKFYPYILGSFNLEKAHRLVTIEGDFAIGKIVAYHYVILVCKGYNCLKEVPISHGRCRVIGIIEPDHFGLCGSLFWYRIEIG